MLCPANQAWQQSAAAENRDSKRIERRLVYVNLRTQFRASWNIIFKKKKKLS